MATDWNNKLINANPVTGTVSVISTWSVWNCLKGEWDLSVPPVVLRNTMIGALYPKPADRFIIGAIDNQTKDPKFLNPFTPPDSRKFTLDLASNSRTHGRFLFNSEEIGENYYGNTPDVQWKRIIYGSILHTGCKQMVYKEIKYIVVDDERVNEKGALEDDKTHSFHWRTGDSHAKASKSLMEFLGLNKAHEEEEDKIIDLGIPIQFRMAVRDKWVGKGTIAYNKFLDTELGGEYDLVIPLSCMKGKKLETGVYEDIILMGLVFEGEERMAKPGWMFFQWFPMSALLAPNNTHFSILRTLREKCAKLAKAYNSIKDLAEILRVSQAVKDDNLLNPNADIIDNHEQSEGEYISPLIRIIQVDVHGVLLLHPYIIRKIQERLQLQWLILATAAGVRFYSVMCQPDETLDIYYKDGAPDGKKVMCAPDFKPGLYIVFCNPMRHWGDCQIWENIHTGTYANGTGLIAATRKQLLGLGRDTDGDFMQLIPVTRFPSLAAAINKFPKAPDTVKFDKIALKGDLREVAINSMNNFTGVAANLLGRAAAAGVEHHYIDIPPGGLQTETKNMKIVDFLSQQVQIAVDSLKSAYPNNMVGMAAVTKYIDSIGVNQIPWLKGFKDPLVYSEYKCPVNEEANDTISQIVKTVNSYWRKPDLGIVSSPTAYKDALFKLYPDVEHQLELANIVRLDYAAQISDAIEWKKANGGSSKKIKEVSQLFKSKRDDILATLKPNQIGQTYSADSWAAAYWKVCHVSETGSAGLVFLLWIDEIIKELKSTSRVIGEAIKIFNTHKSVFQLQMLNGWGDRNPRVGYSGKVVSMRLVWIDTLDKNGNVKGKRLAVTIMKYNEQEKGYQIFGTIASDYTAGLQVGETRDMAVYNHRVRPDYVLPQTRWFVTEAWLFDPNMMTTIEMENWVRNPPSKG
jgi:hypothetical protein